MFTLKLKFHAQLWAVLILLLSSCTKTPVTALATSSSIAATPRDAERVLPTEEELTSLLKHMVNDERRATGMVIGMIAPGEKIIVAYGSLNGSGGRVPDTQSLFEIGSISKVFIGTLLADAVQRGELHLDDPASMYLPSRVKLPEYEGTPITLLDLATHTSGLPREMTTREELTSDNWTQAMYDFLSGYQLTYKPGTKFVYSNLGMTLLAHILELRTGMDYEQLVSVRILQPLGMTSTVFEPSAEMLLRLASGHNSVLYPVDTYGYKVPEHVYVGGMISNADDMLRFASAAMGLESTPLLPAFQNAMQPWRFAQGDQSGLAWRVVEGNAPIIYHNGNTDGMHAYLGLDPQRKVAVVVLSNAAISVDDIGPHLLHPEKYALEKFKPRAVLAAKPIDPAILASYAGKYEFDHIVIDVRVYGNNLILSIADIGPLTLVHETDTQFAAMEYDASVSFMIDQGVVTGLVLVQADDSQTYTFKRVEPPE